MALPIDIWRCFDALFSNNSEHLIKTNTASKFMHNYQLSVCSKGMEKEVCVEGESGGRGRRGEEQREYIPGIPKDFLLKNLVKRVKNHRLTSVFYY